MSFNFRVEMTSEHPPASDARSCDASETAADGTPIEDLIDEIANVHHVRLRQQVLRIDHIVRDLVVHGNDGDAPLVDIQQLVQGLSACIESQLTTEEQVVFPTLRRLQRQTSITKCRAGMIQSRVLVTEREFARIRGAMLRLRDLAIEYASPQGPCEMCHELLRAVDDVLLDLRVHADKELGVLYPWAVARERSLAT